MGVDNNIEFCGGDDSGVEIKLVLQSNWHDDVGEVGVGFV